MSLVSAYQNVLVVPDSSPSSCTLAESLVKLVNSPDWSDVKFEVEGRTVYGHRALLAIRSRYFAELLTDLNDAGREGEVGNSRYRFHSLGNVDSVYNWQSLPIFSH